MVPVGLFRELLVARDTDGNLTRLLVIGLRLARQWTWRNLTHRHDRWILEFTRRLGRPLTMLQKNKMLLTQGIEAVLRNNVTLPS